MTEVGRTSCRPRPVGRTHSGMTLIELMLAMAATGIVGIGIASMLQAVSYGTSSSQDIRELVVKANVVDGRLAAAIRESQAVLADDDDLLVLWTYDGDGDGLPALHELRRIAYDAAADQLVVFTADEDHAVAIYALDDDFAAITEDLIDDDELTRETWADGITALQFTLDEADASDARLVSYRITLGAGTLEHVVASAVALRN